MPSGIRVQLSVTGPSSCPVLDESDEEVTATDITWTRAGDDTVTEEFRVPRPVPESAPDEAEPVIDVGDRRVFRLERPATSSCVCRLIEDLGHPVEDVQAADGALLMTLHLPDREALREVVATAGEVADRVGVRYLVSDDVDGDREAPTVVDYGQLTSRQREVVETAVRMGYFSYPRDSNATAVAEELDIAVSTFGEHLATAQAKLLDGIVES